MFCFSEAGPVLSPVTCCLSKLKRTKNTDPCVIWDPAGLSIPIGAGLKTIIIKNPTSAVMPLDLMLIQSGGVEFSLTGEFMTGSADTGVPGPDYDAMPFSIVLGPHESIPLTFTAKVKAIPFPGTGPGPKWTEWQLLKLCNVLPNDPIDPIDDPHTIASTLVHVPASQPLAYDLPFDLRDYGFAGGDDDFDWFSLQTTPGELLQPQDSGDLQNFFPDSLVPFASVQGSDGSIAGNGQTLYSSKPRNGPIRRFFRWVRARNT